MDIKKLVSLTIDLDINEPIFDSRTLGYKVNIGDILTKYNYSILTHSIRNKLEFVAKEIRLSSSDILVGFACSNIQEVLDLRKLLEPEQLQISLIFIPSKERILKRKLDSLKNSELHGRWVGASAQEVEDGFKKIENILEEIKRELPTHEIRVEEV